MTSPDQVSLSRDIQSAVAIISQGGIVAFPTETYYGLAADPFNEDALKRLFRIKKRLETKPILVILENVSFLHRLTDFIPQMYAPLIRRFWPGPLTLIFKARQELPILLTGASGTVGARMSSHPVAGRLVATYRSPLTATSANISGFPAACSAEQVNDQLGPEIDYIIDGGITPGTQGSTIIAAAGDTLRLIRQGGVSFSEICSAAGM